MESNRAEERRKKSSQATHNEKDNKQTTGVNNNTHNTHGVGWDRWVQRELLLVACHACESGEFEMRSLMRDVGMAPYKGETTRDMRHQLPIIYSLSFGRPLFFLSSPPLFVVLRCLLCVGISHVGFLLLRSMSRRSRAPPDEHLLSSAATHAAPVDDEDDGDAAALIAARRAARQAARLAARESAAASAEAAEKSRAAEREKRQKEQEDQQSESAPPIAGQHVQQTIRRSESTSSIANDSKSKKKRTIDRTLTVECFVQRWNQEQVQEAYQRVSRERTTAVIKLATLRFVDVSCHVFSDCSRLS